MTIAQPKALDGATLGALRKLAASLGELEVTVGPQARPVIAEVRARLDQAAARSAAADMPGAVALIGEAMERLALLGRELDAGEGGLMRMVAERFSQALSAGDKGAAKIAVNQMRRKAGDPRDEPNSEW